MLHAPLGPYYGPRFSPDGKRLAFSMVKDNGRDIWVKDLDRDAPSRLSFLPGVNRLPLWTPDGKSIVFRSDNSAAPGLCAIRSDGSGEVKRLTEGKATANPASFSPDGKLLAISTTGKNGRPRDLFKVPVEADAGPVGPGRRLGKPEPFLGTPISESLPAFSPDGHWLAYQSDESGTPEVYVRPFPEPGSRWQVSTGVGGSLRWSHDGRELLFNASDRRLMAAPSIGKGESFVAGKPRVWTEIPARQGRFALAYDITPDAKRLAAMVADDAGDDKLPTHPTFLSSFFDELRRKAPVGN